MDYKIANSVAQALQLLKESKGGARIIAGGTDLMVDIGLGKFSPELLVDISRIPELQAISLRDGYLVIGSAVTHNALIANPDVQAYAPALVTAVKTIGSKQIRNAGTLAGNVIAAHPEADGAMALTALGTMVEIASESGVRTIPVEEMYNGKGGSTLDSTKELVTAILVPCGEKKAASFIRIQLRNAMAPPILSTCVCVEMEGDQISTARISMSPVDMVPKHAAAAEAYLKGKPLNTQTVEEATKLALEDAHPLDNPFRGSKEYQLQVLPVLIKRGFADVARQLGKSI